MFGWDVVALHKQGDIARKIKELNVNNRMQIFYLSQCNVVSVLYGRSIIVPKTAGGVFIYKHRLIIWSKILTDPAS